MFILSNSLSASSSISFWLCSISFLQFLIYSASTKCLWPRRNNREEFFKKNDRFSSFYVNMLLSWQRIILCEDVFVNSDWFVCIMKVEKLNKHKWNFVACWLAASLCALFVPSLLFSSFLSSSSSPFQWHESPQSNQMSRGAEYGHESASVFIFFFK